jgi:hypothetical protein
MTQLFVLCTTEIRHHGNHIAFRKGHVYIAERQDDGAKNVSKYNMVSDYNDTIETFPKHIFNANFKVMFPVMGDLG